MNREPSYNLVESKLADVRHLFAEHHAYASVGIWSTYCYAVIEDGAPVAAFTWQPPPPTLHESCVRSARRACCRSRGWLPCRVIVASCATSRSRSGSRW
jgi:hypothetical protein